MSRKIGLKEYQEFTKNECIILDVRTKMEYDIRHLEGAIAFEDFECDFERITTDLDMVILVYCQIGVRSQMIVDDFLFFGYKNVYDLGGVETDFIKDLY